VFKCKAMIKISGPKREVVTREWRKIHIGELYDL
jgi:hypothetical protein